MALEYDLQFLEGPGTGVSAHQMYSQLHSGEEPEGKTFGKLMFFKCPFQRRRRPQASPHKPSLILFPPQHIPASGDTQSVGNNLISHHKSDAKDHSDRALIR